MPKKEIKKISVNQMDKNIPETLPFPVSFGEGEDKIEVICKPRISFTDGLSFVNNVVSAVVDEDLDRVVFSVKEFSIRTNTLEMFTNIRLPENIEKKYDLVFGTKIYEQIVDDINFDGDVYDIFLAAIDEQIAFESQKMLSQFKSETQTMIDHINTEGEQIINTFAEFGKAFKDVTPEQISALIPKIVEMGKIDEKELASAVLDIQSKKDSEENATIFQH
jgi:hypothetical protein